MPLCGIISSEGLGTLPGAWAKQCENVLEVNGCEWLWDTAWAAGARALQWIRNRLSCGHPASWKLSLAGAVSPFLTHTFFFILRFLLISVSVLSPHHQTYTTRYTQVGHSKPTWCVLHVVMFCPPLVSRDEHIKPNQTWGLCPVNHSSEDVKWQK